MLYLPIQRFLQIRSLLVIVFLASFLAGECDAQIRETTLGTVRIVATPVAFTCMKQLSAGDPSGVSLLLWNPGSKDLYIARIDSTLESSTMEHRVLLRPFDDLLILDRQNGSAPELVFISKTDRTMSVVFNLAMDTLEVARTIPLPFAPTGWAVGDLNNDGNPDILLVDRNNPGLVPMLQKGAGNFIMGKLIAPELPAGSIALTHLNNDNLIDVVVYDWVKSELHLLYGVGRGRFLDQSTFRVEGDVTQIIPTKLDPLSNLDLVLVCEHAAEVQDWQGNGIGDFRLTKQTFFQDTLVSYSMGDLNGDQWVDFGYIGHSPLLQIVMNNGDDWSQERIQFACGEDPVSLMLHDFNNDGKADALVLDRSGKELRFYLNGAQDNTLRDSLEFAAAPSPEGVLIHKVGFGDMDDLAVVNSGGRSLSLYTGRPSGGLLGLTTFSLSISPQFISFHSLTDSSARFVITSSAGDSLLVLSLNFRDSSSSYAVIPSEGSVQLVQSGVNPSGQVEFLTFNTFAGGQNPDIHYYERLDPGTFIEQSFHLLKPDELLGATAEYVNADQYPDLVYIFHNADSGSVNLAVSYGDSLMAYSQRHSTIELPRADTVASYIWTGSFGRADTPDVLIYFGAPVNTLEQARGKGNGQFEEPVVLVPNVKLANRSMLQLVDADNDGWPDIVLNDANTAALGWLRGEPNGSFEPRQTLISLRANDYFAVGDLNGDGIGDVAVSRAKKGTIMIYNGAGMFSKERRAESK